MFEDDKVIMPFRILVTKELARLLGVLAHPHRVRIIEELRQDERDVNSLQALLGISHSGVSQHLSVLRAHRLVSERRDGRHVFYRLRQPELARWLAEGMKFLVGDPDQANSIQAAVQHAQALWTD